MSFKKFAAAENAANKDKTAAPSKADAAADPQAKTSDKTPTPETPAANA